MAGESQYYRQMGMFMLSRIALVRWTSVKLALSPLSIAQIVRNSRAVVASEEEGRFVVVPTTANQRKRCSIVRWDDDGRGDGWREGVKKYRFVHPFHLIPIAHKKVISIRGEKVDISSREEPITRTT
jgi:hypothetical protein